MLRTVDPEGLTIEIVDATASHNAYEAPNHEQSYLTGRLGVGHFTFQSADLERFERFYVDALGLEVTDYNGLVPSPGGVLISHDGVLVGAIGVSGDTGPNDELCAVAGIEAAGLVAQL
jgi:uncharacterized protein GlcG (DUF336 family)